MKKHIRQFFHQFPDTTSPSKETNPHIDPTSPVKQDEGIYAWMAGQLVRFSPDGTKMEILQTNTGEWLNSSYSGYYYYSQNNSLARIDLKTGEHFVYPGTENYTSYTIGGDTLFFQTENRDTGEVLLKSISLDGKNLRTLVRLSDYSASNAPIDIQYLDGKIFYTDSPKGYGEYMIYSISPDGQNRTQVAAYSALAVGGVDMQTDRKYLYYVSSNRSSDPEDYDYHAQIHAVNPKAHEDQVIGETACFGENPIGLSFNGDGFLYFMLNYDVYRIPTDGSSAPERLFDIHGEIVGISNTHIFIRKPVFGGSGDSIEYHWYSFDLKTGKKGLSRNEPKPVVSITTKSPGKRAFNVSPDFSQR